MPSTVGARENLWVQRVGGGGGNRRESGVGGCEVFTEQESAVGALPGSRGQRGVAGRCSHPGIQSRYGQTSLENLDVFPPFHGVGREENGGSVHCPHPGSQCCLPPLQSTVSCLLEAWPPLAEPGCKVGAQGPGGLGF